MHVVHVWDYFPMELRYHIHYLTDELTALGHQVTILASDKSNRQWIPFLETIDPPAGEYRYGEARVIRFASWSFQDKQVPRKWSQFRNALVELRPDVLHLFGIPRPMSLGAALHIRRRPNRPVVFVNDHSHAMMANTTWIGRCYYRLWEQMYRWFIGPHVEKVIVPTLASRQYLQKRYRIPDENIELIPLGYDCRQFVYDPDLKNDSSQLVLGFAGKLEPAKRIEVLFQAIAQCRHRAKLDCHVVGDGGDAYSNKLRAMAKEMNLDVTFRPLMKRDELARFYNYLDVAVFPGGISITTHEATGCGTPVLLYESIPGLEDRVAHGRGYLFREIHELTELIDRFVAKKQARTIDHQSICDASREWSWNRIAKRYLAEYERALQARASRLESDLQQRSQQTQ
jgi:glycosyltransferase involved in cell wall biosynthesis